MLPAVPQPDHVQLKSMKQSRSDKVCINRNLSRNEEDIRLAHHILVRFLWYPVSKREQMESHADDEELCSELHPVRVWRPKWPGLSDINEYDKIEIHHKLHLLAGVGMHAECYCDQRQPSDDEKQEVASLSSGGCSD